MSTIDGADRERLTRPLSETTGRFYVVLGIATIFTVAMVVAYYFQLRDGMQVTGMTGWGQQGGAPWALYIGTFVWWIGLAHGGIAISAAVRLFDLETYLPIARIAEGLTLIALPMATLNIMFDIGRPDRMYMVLSSWPTTISTSPLAWDVTAVVLYFTLSATYLTITIRADIYELQQQGALPTIFSPIYKILMLGYEPDQGPKTRQMAWWLAIGILLLVPLLSGGVVPWLFATMGMHPGWFGASHGPAMLAESLTSAVAIVLVTAAAFRYGYKWDDLIDDAVFTGLNKALIVLVLAVFWFQLQSLVTGSYPAAPQSTADVTAALVSGSMAVPFWLAMGAMGAALAYFVAQALRPELFSVGASVVAALLVSGAILLKKTIFVVEGLLYPTQAPLQNMFPDGAYFPSAIELVVSFGTIALGVLLMLVATKVIPMVELGDALGTPPEHDTPAGPDEPAAEPEVGAE